MTDLLCPLHFAPMQQLLLATTALRDLYAGYPPDEVAARKGKGLGQLLQELTAYLRGNGIDDEGALDCDLTQAIQVANGPAPGFMPPALVELKQLGLTIGDCTAALAVGEADQPYVEHARQLIEGDPDMEIDDQAVISESEGGAWVLTWLWVSDNEAGIEPTSELLEAMLDCARAALERTGGNDVRLQQVQADWLEELISNFPDELDEISHDYAHLAPCPVAWHDEEGEEWAFRPSEAIASLLQLAIQPALGNFALKTKKALQVQRFAAKYGAKLDGMLTVVRAA